MKLRNIIVYNIILAIIVVATSQVVTHQLTGSYTFEDKPTANFQRTADKCTDKPLSTRPATTDPQLKVVSEYETACKSAFIDNLMVFTKMPISTQNAEQMADTMTAKLRQFDNFGIKPIIIIEPDSDWGLVDFHEYSTGFYDQWMRDYFARLKTNGIASDQLGIWVPFPEPQQTYWNNNADPDDFALSVNRYFGSLRDAYPKAKTAILLDSQTGETNQAPQLLAYTRLIKDGLVDYAGIQGFPWHPGDPNDKRESVTSAAAFIPASLTEEVAKSLNTNHVFINTGTFRHKKATDGGFITVTTDERQKTLESIRNEVTKLQKDKYDVLLNIFSENKLETKEGVDWSYWQPGLSGQSDHTNLLTTFINELKKDNVAISLYDAR